MFQNLTNHRRERMSNKKVRQDEELLFRVFTGSTITRTYQKYCRRSPRDELCEYELRLTNKMQVRGRRCKKSLVGVAVVELLVLPQEAVLYPQQLLVGGRAVPQLPAVWSYCVPSSPSKKMLPPWRIVCFVNIILLVGCCSLSSMRPARNNFVILFYPERWAHLHLVISTPL